MNQLNNRLEDELLHSFKLYADPNYNEDLLPISVIEFSAQGEITSPPDLEFMGYSAGPEGEPFNACGGLDLSAYFPLTEEGDYSEDLEDCFYKAADAVVAALKLVSKSECFAKLPKKGPIVFKLDLEDQIRKVLCRIHPDGAVELPPES